MKTAFFFALCLAVALSAFVDIQNNTVVTFNIGVEVDSEQAARDVKLYRIWVPENSFLVNITGFTTDYSLCYHPQVMVSGHRGEPCSFPSTDYPSQNLDNIVPCDNYESFYGGYSGNQFGAFDGYSSIVGDMKLGAYWYIGVRKQYSSEYSNDCPYELLVQISTCNSNELGWGTSSNAKCIPSYPATVGAPFTTVNISDTTEVAYWVNFATEQNHVDIIVNTTDDLLEVSGAYGHLSDTGYKCYDSGVSNGQLILHCYSIPAGNFYLMFTTSASAPGATAIVQISGSTCGNGTTGINCAYGLTAYNPQTSYTGHILGQVSGVEYITNNFYLDFPANSTGEVNVSISCTGGDGVFTYKKDAFAYYYSYNAQTGSSYGYDFSADQSSIISAGETVGFFLRNEDLWTGGRYYFSVSQYSLSGDFNYTVTPNYVNPTTSSGTTTTGSGTTTTGSGTTTTNTGTTTTGSGSGTTGTTGVRTTTGTTGVRTTTGTTGTRATTGAVSGTTSAPVTTHGSGAGSVVPALFLVAMLLALVL